MRRYLRVKLPESTDAVTQLLIEIHFAYDWRSHPASTSKEVFLEREHMQQLSACFLDRHIQ